MIVEVSDENGILLVPVEAVADGEAKEGVALINNPTILSVKDSWLLAQRLFTGDGGAMIRKRWKELIVEVEPAISGGGDRKGVGRD